MWSWGKSGGARRKRASMPASMETCRGRAGLASLPVCAASVEVRVAASLRAIGQETIDLFTSGTRSNKLFLRAYRVPFSLRRVTSRGTMNSPLVILRRQAPPRTRSVGASNGEAVLKSKVSPLVPRLHRVTKWSFVTRRRWPAPPNGATTAPAGGTTMWPRWPLAQCCGCGGAGVKRRHASRHWQRERPGLLRHSPRI